ncbi:MAG: hypothetical protein HUJ91_08025, partial [Bacteroidales bacterium]|nr:hypothetical protein [Bacteroidales bacterium]
MEDVAFAADTSAPAQDAVGEAMLALKALGYTPQEAANALKPSSKTKNVELETESVLN